MPSKFTSSPSLTNIAQFQRPIHGAQSQICEGCKKKTTISGTNSIKNNDRENIITNNNQ